MSLLRRTRLLLACQRVCRIVDFQVTLPPGFLTITQARRRRFTNDDTLAGQPTKLPKYSHDDTNYGVAPELTEKRAGEGLASLLKMGKGTLSSPKLPKSPAKSPAKSPVPPSKKAQKSPLLSQSTTSNRSGQSKKSSRESSPDLISKEGSSEDLRSDTSSLGSLAIHSTLREESVPPHHHSHCHQRRLPLVCHLLSGKSSRDSIIFKESAMPTLFAGDDSALFANAELQALLGKGSEDKGKQNSTSPSVSAQDEDRKKAEPGQGKSEQKDDKQSKKTKPRVSLDNLTRYQGLPKKEPLDRSPKPKSKLRDHLSRYESGTKLTVMMISTEDRGRFFDALTALSAV
eukprot:Em0015g41a